MAHRASILLCDDDALYQRTLVLGLGDQFHVEYVATGSMLLQALRQRRPDVLLLDLCFGALEAGFDLIEEVLVLRPGLPIIVHSGLDDYAAIVRAMQLGASTYVPKHGGIDALVTALRQQLARAPAPEACGAACEPAHFLGGSAAARQVRAALAVFARSEGHVLITGDAGVGKRVAALALFRPGRPWVELAGATAAEDDVAIAVASARGGILFVDSLTDCPLVQQRALWRALDRQNRSSAGKAAQPCRVVTTARGDLAELRASSMVCSDLLARIAVLVLPVPALVARREDLAGLVAHFGAELGAKQRSQVSREVLDALLGYSWPGNVRELANAVQYMHAMAAGQPAERRHLPPEVQAASGRRLGAPTATGAAASGDVLAEAAAGGARAEGADAAAGRGSFRSQCRDFEREVLRRAYEAAGGHIATMSQALELNRTYLYEKLKAYRIVGR